MGNTESLVSSVEKEEIKMAKLKKGDKVKVEYTGKLSDGQIFDTSKGREPLCFEIGTNQVIPGFEKNIESMKKNEEKTFTLSAEESYGPVRAELIQEVPRSKLPEKPEPKEGMMLILKDPNGREMPVRIAKVTKETVTIDLNHPLAGKELTFEVKLIGINEKETKKDEDEGCSDCSSCPGCH